MAAFAELGLLPELAAAVDDMGWMLPTDIQQEGIPAILGGADVCMAAETGSGKTGAFCLPVLQIVWEQLREATGTAKKPKLAPKDTWGFNMFDRDRNFSVNNERMICESTHPKAWNGGRINKGVMFKGKYYYESTIHKDGLCRMGWSTADAHLNLGTCENGFGFGGTGKKSHAGNFDDYGESFTLGDVIGSFLDLDNGTIHFSKNGKQFPTAFKISPAIVNHAFFPAMVLKCSGLEVNLGAKPFKFPPKKDYVGVCQATSEYVVFSPAKGYGSNNEKKRPAKAPLCVIFEPTIDLAKQTHEQISFFAKKLETPRVRSCLIVGRESLTAQIEDINQGVDIITCTPGRVFDLVEKDNISLNFVQFFVLDEADSLVSGAQSQFKTIIEMHRKIPSIAPNGNALQTIVCSATLHDSGVHRFAAMAMHFPQWVDLRGTTVVPDTVHQVVCLIDPVADKSWIRLRAKHGNSMETDAIHSSGDIKPGSSEPETLSEGVKVLRGEYVIKAIKHFNMDQCIIFCRMKSDCDRLEAFMKTQGNPAYWTTAVLHSERAVAERDANLLAFKTGKARFLICTDVAARGIDVRGVPFVINASIPSTVETANYVHRIGRVGRADRMGLAISLASAVPEKVWFHKCRSRGCTNAKLTNQGGCAIWANDLQSLAEVEEHIGMTVNRVSPDFDVPVDEFDGKVIYGEKRSQKEQHFELGQSALKLSGIVHGLNHLERAVQLSYWQLLNAS